LSRPGIDPRAWVVYARIDDDKDAIVWDPELGWFVDVTIVSGSLAGEPALARVSADALVSGGRYTPPRANALVLLAVPNGDLNDEAVVLTQLHTIERGAPTTINGDTIVERDPQAGEVAALATHLAVFPGEDCDEEWRERRVTTSGAHKLHGDTMELGVAGADQSYVRGEDKADADEALASAVDTYNQQVLAAFAAMLPPGIPATPVTAANISAGIAIITPASAALSAAVAQFNTARTQYLSTRIKGD
jgi:hypothetical protein